MTRRSSDGSRPLTHAFVGPVITQIFEEIDVGASVWDRGRWRGIHWQSALPEFELEHRGESKRRAYNDRSLARAREARTTVLSEHAGFCDLFTPICVKGVADAVIVVGPFATSRSTSAQICDRWRILTGRQAHLADPELLRYVAATNSALVLEGSRLVDLQRLVGCLAQSMAGHGSPRDILDEVERLRPRLTAARLVDRIWSAARSIVDERTSHVWASPVRAEQWGELGLTRFPDSAVVGLFVSPRAGPDPIDELLRRHALQRQCVEVARDFGNALSGQLGDHGVSFLCGGSGSRARTQARLTELVDRSATIARRRFGITAHFGLSTLALPITEQFHAALAAAELALSQGQRVVHAESSPARGGTFGAVSPSLRELASLAEQSPRAMPARFDRFLELIATRSGHRLEIARVYVEAAFERIAEEVLKSGSLDEKGLSEVRSTLVTNANAATTIHDLFAIYRSGLGDLLATVEHPVVARRERSLRRVEEYLRRNYSAPLDFARVARIAGFAPSYFSTLFREKQGVTVERYLSNLRLARARELLSTTDLSVERVARLSGFSSGHYLARVFKRATRQTPLAFRRGAAVKPRKK
jgi:AraC-like DNA-binding protein